MIYELNLFLKNMSKSCSRIPVASKFVVQSQIRQIGIFQTEDFYNLISIVDFPSYMFEATCFKLQVLRSRFWVTSLSYCFQDTGFRLQFLVYRFYATSFMLQVLGYRFYATSFRLQVLGYSFHGKQLLRLQVLGYIFMAICFGLHISGYIFSNLRVFSLKPVAPRYIG